MLIIGITGTLGAGKGTVVEYLVSQYGFTHFSVRTFLLEEIRKRGYEENRDSMVRLANEMRTLHGPSTIIERLYEMAAEKNNNCIIESIRTPGEITALRQKQHFYLLAVDAEQTTRYERIRIRNSETDRISFETFKGNEEREMHADDPAKQNLSACISQADHVIYNNGRIEDLHQEVDLFIRKLDIAL